jgi:hypothetical protein
MARVLLARARAERSRSIASRVTTVVRYARGDSIASVATPRRRTTTSSASLTVPSIR